MGLGLHAYDGSPQLLQGHVQGLIQHHELVCLDCAASTCTDGLVTKEQGAVQVLEDRPGLVLSFPVRAYSVPYCTT